MNRERRIENARTQGEQSERESRAKGARGRAEGGKRGRKRASERARRGERHRCGEASVILLPLHPTPGFNLHHRGTAAPFTLARVRHKTSQHTHRVENRPISPAPALRATLPAIAISIDRRMAHPRPSKKYLMVATLRTWPVANPRWGCGGTLGGRRNGWRRQRQIGCVISGDVCMCACGSQVGA